jgi:hypothetical protein
MKGYAAIAGNKRVMQRLQATRVKDHGAMILDLIFQTYILNYCLKQKFDTLHDIGYADERCHRT